MQLVILGTATHNPMIRSIVYEQVQPRLIQQLADTDGQGLDIVDYSGDCPDDAQERILHAERLCEAQPPWPLLVLLDDGPLSETVTQDIHAAALSDAAHRQRTVFCYVAQEDVTPDATVAAFLHQLHTHFPALPLLRCLRTESAIVTEESYLPLDEALTAALTTAITAAQQPLDEQAVDEALHRAYMEKYAVLPYSRHKRLDDCRQTVAAHAPVVLLTGEENTGKSAVLSRLLVTWQNEGAHRAVLPIYVGATTAVDTGMEVLYRIVWYLETALGKKHEFPHGFDAWKDREEWLCREYQEANLPHLLIGIDAAHRLRRGNVAQELLFLPSGSYRNLQCVVSFSTAMTVPKRLLRAPLITLECLDEQETRGIVRETLEEITQYPLSPTVEERLMTAARGKGSLYLDMLIQALRLTTVEQDADREQAQLATLEQVIPPYGDLLSLCRRFFTWACNRVDPQLYTALRHIAATPQGATTELLAALQPESFDICAFYRLRHDLREMLILRADGRYDLVHRCLRQALFFINENAVPDDPAVSQQLFDLLYELPDTHPVRIGNLPYVARNCQQYTFLTDYILYAYRYKSRQHRRAPLAQLLKDHTLRKQLIAHVDTYMCSVAVPSDDKNALCKNAAQRLARFCRTFGQLFAQHDENERDEVLACTNTYLHLLSQVDHAFSLLQRELLHHRDTLIFSVSAYFFFLCEWFVCCATYDLCRQQQALFVSSPDDDREVLGDEDIDAAFFDPLPPDIVKAYDAMDHDTFKQRFFTYPHRTFRELVRLWLHADCRYDLARLFDRTEEAEGYLIRTCVAVAGALCRRPSSTLVSSDDFRARYQAVHARATEQHRHVPSWEELVAVNEQTAPADTTDAVYKTFARLYRDLEYQEGPQKYAAFFAYAHHAVTTLADNSPERAIACCRDALAAAERALVFTGGAPLCWNAYLAFGDTLGQLLTAADATVRLAELERIAERRFALVLDSELTFPLSVHRELLGQNYPQAMQDAYAAADRPVEASQRQAWYAAAFRLACYCLDHADDDPALWYRELAEEGADYCPTQQEVDTAHDELLSIVAAAVEALYGLCRAAAEDAVLTAYYDELEIGVLDLFGDGSHRYITSSLRQRLTTLCKEHAFTTLTALLARLDAALLPYSLSQHALRALLGLPDET